MATPTTRSRTSIFNVPEAIRATVRRTILDKVKLLPTEGKKHCKRWYPCTEGKKRGFGQYDITYKHHRYILKIHRFLLEQRLRRPLKPTELALHTCGVRNCASSEHIFLGNYYHQANGSVARGTHSVASRKLTAEQVRTIRRLAPTVTQRVLAQRFGVSESTIRAAIIGLLWRGVK